MSDYLTVPIYRAVCAENEKNRQRIAELEAENKRLREWQQEALAVLQVASINVRGSSAGKLAERRDALLQALAGGEDL